MQNQYAISSSSWPTVTPSGLIYPSLRTLFPKQNSFFSTFLEPVGVGYNNHLNQHTYQCNSTHYFPPKLKTSFHHENVLFAHQKGKSVICFCLPAQLYRWVIVVTPSFSAFQMRLSLCLYSIIRKLPILLLCACFRIK